MLYTDKPTKSFIFLGSVTIFPDGRFNSNKSRVYLTKLLMNLQEVPNMTILLILGVCFAFLSAIFTGGYDDKPGKVKIPGLKK